MSLHPAGHVLDSAHGWRAMMVVFGCNRAIPNVTRTRPARAFEVIPWDTLITEVAFVLPYYRWPPVSGWGSKSGSGRQGIQIKTKGSGTFMQLFQVRSETYRIIVVFLMGKRFFENIVPPLAGEKFNCLKCCLAGSLLH